MGEIKKKIGYGENPAAGLVCPEPSDPCVAADPWLVQRVQPHAQGPLSLVIRSPQGDTLQLSPFFTPETPVSQTQPTARGWWLGVAAAHGR